MRLIPSYLVVSWSYFSIGRPRVKKHKEVLPGNQRGHDRDRADTRLKAGERRERFFADDDVSLDELVARERKEGRQAKYDAHYADNISRNKQCVHLIHRHCNCMLRLLAACSPHRRGGRCDVIRFKEGYDSDDEYGDGGSAHTKYEERRSRKAGKDHEREQQRAVTETKRMNKMVTNVSHTTSRLI
eukprot:COSAG02_NODE_811_length_16911_cov_343.583095_13_plen_186_part_00